MNFYSKYLDLKMRLSGDRVNTLVLESPKTYRDTVYNLYQAFNDDTEDWIFCEDDKIIKKNKDIEIIDSLFSLNFDHRKIQKAIIDGLYEIAINEEHYERTQKLLSDLEAYFYDLEWKLDYDIEVAIEDFRNVVKNCVSGVAKPDNFMEQMNEYIKIAARLLKSKILILIGIQPYFNQDEWSQIEKTAEYEEIYLLCIERTASLTTDYRVIIDADDCRVV